MLNDLGSWCLLSFLCCACNQTPSGSKDAAPSAAPAPVAAVPAAASVAPEAPLSDEAAEKMALDTTIAFMKTAVADKQRFPMKDAKNYTADDDPNKLLGRPGQYLTKMAWTVSGGDATLEVFRNLDDAKKRADYVDQIGKSSPMFLQYVYLNAKRSAVLRLPKDATPATAKDWQTMFEAL